MKKTLLFLAAIAFSFNTAHAQEEGVEKTLTTNYSQKIEAGGSVACNTEKIGSTENHYFKKFNLKDLGVLDEFHIQSFQFGVQLARPAEFSQETEVELTVELSKTKRNDFPATWAEDSADYEVIATETVVVTAADNGTIITVDFDAPLTVEPDDIVIARVHHDNLYEVIGEDGVPGMYFHIGSNKAGDDQPSYMMAEGCEINTPTATAMIGDGFPDMFIVMNLKGVEGFLGVQDFVNADLSLYPNPASDQFNISSGNETIQTVILRDILGKTIQTIQVNGLSQNVNIANLPKGLYLIEVELETGRAVQKLIKR